MITCKNSIFLLILAMFSSISTIVIAKPITLVLRYDDYSSQSPISFESRLISVLQHYSIPATFAVIPNTSTNISDASAQARHAELQPDRTALLRKAIASGTVSVAQHGYTHEVIARKGEFEGLPYGEQLDRIARGRRMLEKAIGAPVTTFVPPGNAYDNNTLQALGRLGFRGMSACQFGDSDASGRVKLLPEMADVRLIRKYVRMARRVPEARPIIVVMLHPYDFTEVSGKSSLISLEGFAIELSWLKDQKDVRVTTLDQVIADTSGLDGAAFKANMAYQYGLKYYPRLFMQPPHGIYLTEDAARTARIRFTALSGVTYLAVMLIGFVAVRLFRRSERLKSARGVALCMLGIVSLLALALPLRDMRIEWRGVIMALGLAGAWLGILLPMEVKNVRSQKSVRHDRVPETGDTQQDGGREPVG